MSRLRMAASGAVLAAAAFTSAATAYADEPNNQGGQDNQAVQAAAVAPEGTPQNQSVEQLNQPAGQQQAPAVADPNAPNEPNQHEQQADPAAGADPAAAAAGAGAGGAGGMGASIGSSMAMMAPMLAMSAPMMMMPLLSSSLGGLAAAAPSTGADTAATGSAAATDAFSLMSPAEVPMSAAASLPFDLGSGLTPDLDPSMVTDTTTDILANTVSGLPIDAPLDLVDPTVVVDGIAPVIADSATTVAGEAAATGLSVGGEVTCGVVGLIFGVC